MRRIRFFSNLCLRRNPKSLPYTVLRIRNRNLSSVQSNEIPDESTQPPLDLDSASECIISSSSVGSIKIPQQLTEYPPNLDYVNESSSPSKELTENSQNQAGTVCEVARKVLEFIQTRSGWEHTILSEFPDVNFKDPVFYNAVLRQQSDVFPSLAFYHWLRSLNGSWFDRDLCNVMFGRLVEAKALSAAKGLLVETKFDPEPQYLELYIRCLCVNGLFDEAFDVFKQLRGIDYTVSLGTWNLALQCSVRKKMVDFVWRLHGFMTVCGVTSNVTTLGHLIQAFCLENNALKGFQLLQQVLEAGHVPERSVFVKLVSALGEIGQYGKVSAVLHSMIAKDIPLDNDVYQEVIKNLCNGSRIDEGFGIFKQLKRRGYFPNRVMYTTMIHGLCRYKDVGVARQLWFEMIRDGIEPDAYAYNTFIHGLFKSGCVDEAKKLYDEMLSRGIRGTAVTYTTMINGLCLNGEVEEARALFERMIENGIPGDSSKYNILIMGYLLQGKLIEATYFLSELFKHNFQPQNATVTLLIEKLCNAGYVKEAENMWLEMTNMGHGQAGHLLEQIIVGLARQGCMEEAIERLGHLISAGFRPKNATFEGLVEFLCGAEEVVDGRFVLLGYMVKMGVCSLDRLSAIVR